ncbi:AMP-binding protein [SAR202 cluster bacterium AC-647-N09_OGT_505m]|nr:AMP-binding protein [SAR202 cluster bacterium AC-647-N09_OGT_505m]
MTKSAKPSTLLDLLEIGAPNHPAIQVPDGPTITYDALRHQVYALADNVMALGIRRTDRVAIVLPNSAETIISFLGVAAVAIAAPLNPAYKSEEFRFYLEDTSALALMTGSQGGEIAQNAASDTTLPIGVDVDAQGHVTISTPGNGDGARLEETASPNHVALILHTSGTTSRPKRVPLTHGNLAASVANIVETYNLTADDVSLCIMPLFHVHGLVASTLATLASGGTVVVPTRFNALNLWRTVQDYGVTWFTGVPTMHQALLSRARGTQFPGPEATPYSGLRFIRSCSAALPAATMLEMEERFGVPVLEAYGMTEASHQMSSNPLPPGNRLPSSVGKGTGVSIAIMDESGALQPPGIRGEVVIQGPNVIRGYEDNPEANSTSFTDGWFRTGDEGVVDSEGYLTLSGRLKEIINRSGEKISPQEIDEVLLSHPAVAEAVAFGVMSTTHGEEPSAAVVLRRPVTQAELIRYCRNHLADFKCPRVIHIVSEIPRTATGKIQRRIVAEATAEKISGAPP